MGIVTKYVGNLGGADVEVTPVNVTASGGNGSEVVMHTVTVPAGETWLVALIGTLTPFFTTSSGPTLHVGDAKMGPYLNPGLNSVAVKQSGVVVVKIRRGNGFDEDSFAGHVYAVKI